MDRKKTKTQQINTFCTDCLSYLAVVESLLTARLSSARGSLSRHLSCCLSNNKYFCQTVKAVEQSQKQTSTFIWVNFHRYQWNFVTHNENPRLHTTFLPTVFCYTKLLCPLNINERIWQLLSNMTQTKGLQINSLVLMLGYHSVSQRFRLQTHLKTHYHSCTLGMRMLVHTGNSEIARQK